MNHCEKCLEMSLERQNHDEEGIREILSNQSNLRLNLCVNRVSSVIPS